MFHLTTMNSLTTAQIVNQKYSSNASVFESPEQRINNYLNAVQGSLTELNGYISKFKQLNPNLTANQIQIQLPLAHMVKLSDIVIDDTMNRPLDWKHLMGIIEKFDPVLVDGVRVYEDINLPGKLVAWDGHHTTLALYIIFCMIFGKKPEDVIIPVTVNRSNIKSDIRKTFIKHSSSTKKGGIKLELSPLDLYSQEIFGVRIDKSTDPNWIISEQKQTSLEKADLYLIDKNNYSSLVSDGAITRPSDVIEEDPFIVEQFAEYWSHRSALKGNSIVEPKEIVIICQLLHAFKNANVTLTSTDFTNMIALFNRSFKIGFGKRASIYDRLNNAFNAWYKKTYKHPKTWDTMTDAEKLKYPSRPDTFTVSSNEQTTHTVAYLAALLNKFSSVFPISGMPRIDVQFTPDMKDVY